MALDPGNPAIPAGAPINPEFLASHQKMSQAMVEGAAATKQLAAAADGAPTTEGGIFLQILSSVLVGKLAATSDDAVIWAKDLTQEYLKLYDLLGAKRG
jgi:hypothetical protein